MCAFVPFGRSGLSWGMSVVEMPPVGVLVGAAGYRLGFADLVMPVPEWPPTVVPLTSTNRDAETVDVLCEQVVQAAREAAP